MIKAAGGIFPVKCEYLSPKQIKKKVEKISNYLQKCVGGSVGLHPGPPEGAPVTQM